MTQLDTTTVSTAIEVAAEPHRAFAVFTEGLNTWWERGHHLLDGELAEVGIEPFVGGRVWERNETGDTCDWGRVLAWEPGERFAFSWRIGPDWAVPATDAPASTVTVTFTPAGSGTRVELVHSDIDVHGQGWEELRDSVAGPGGWPLHLSNFSRAAQRS